MSLITDLSEVAGEAFAAAGVNADFGQVVVSQRPDLGQFQCNGALPAAQQAGSNPRELAERVTEALVGDRRFSDVSIAGPGFINLTLTDEALAAAVDAISHDPRLGVVSSAAPERIIVDYAGPNVAKSMHAGHLRATIIGDSLKRLFRFAGHDVLGDAHFGDWGLQMGMLIVACEDRMADLVYFDPDFPGPYPTESPVSLADLEEWYPQISSAVDEDQDLAARARATTTELQAGRAGYVALWEHFVRVSRESQEQDFADLGVEFDLWYGESTVRDRFEPLATRLFEDGIAVESDGALVVPISEPSDKAEMAPFILRTSHGAFIYNTFDLATVEMRADQLAADLVLYVVDARQAYHFEQVFRAARKSGIAPAEMELEHVKFGTMNGPNGKPFMTRAGGVLRLRDLIEMVTEAAGERLEESELASGYPAEERATIARHVGLAALKFGDLINNRTSNYLFDLERFTSFEGKTGPYLLFAAVRIKSILRNAAETGAPAGPVIAPTKGAERSLMLRLAQLPEVVERAIELRTPSQLAEYAYEVSSDFSRFYEACHILSEADGARRGSWLTLVETTLATLDLLLDLLGIEIPERM